MPRIARYVESNGYYHVISRSINETWVFKDEHDFNHFQYLQRQAKSKYPIRLFHYVLMNTHFHLVLQAITHKDLSSHLSFIKWHYTLWMRRKYGWLGPLWRERYKNLPIESTTYLTACGRYVEYNPVRAGICDDPTDYLYSSYKKYAYGRADTLLDEYEAKFESDLVNMHDYRTELSRKIFSQAASIGSPLYVEGFRSSANVKNGCPQK